MPSKAKTVQEYLDELPPDRREAIDEIRAFILENLPPGYEEGMQWGDIGYFVPYAIYPDGYDAKPKVPLQYLGLANQKNNLMMRFLSMYTHPELRASFEDEYRASGKKLDMGGGCLRFKKIEQLPLEVVGKLIGYLPVDKFVARYDQKRNELKKK